MAEFDMQIVSFTDEPLLMTRQGNVFNLEVHDVTVMNMKRVGSVLPIIIHDVIPYPMKRIVKTYNNGVIIPLRIAVKNEDGTESPIKKEIREWDMILPFGSGNEAPRRRPLDIAWTKKQF